MKIVIEVELGNDEMQTYKQVESAVAAALTGSFDPHNTCKLGEQGHVWDRNGNKVGKWRVKRDARTNADRVLPKRNPKPSK